MVAVSPTLAIRYAPIASLNPAPYNPREMSEEQMAALMASLSRFGFVDPVVIRGSDRLVIGGHQRMEAARRLGWSEVPVVEVELSDDECRAANIALNKIHGEFDIPKLAALLESLPRDLQALTGFDEKAMAQVLHDAEAALRALQAEQDVDAVPAPPDAATTKRGDRIVLGRHVLMCGDSGSTEDLDRLLSGARIHLLNTDPPYNTKVEPRSNNAIAMGGVGMPSPDQARAFHHQGLDLARHPGKSTPTTSQLRPKDRPLINDFIPAEEFETKLRAWFKNAARAMEPGATAYVWGGYSNLANYPAALKESGFYFSQGIVWDKGWPVLTRKDFLGAFELAFYCWKEGAAHRWFGPSNIPDLWEVRKVNPVAMVHLTEKPVELAERALTYSSLPGENVLDLFGGSGSTLIAAERTGRNAFLMEMDELYADVIVARWEQFTGQKAVRS